MRLLVFLLLLLTACSKTEEVAEPLVPEVEIRIVNGNDANVTGFVLRTRFLFDRSWLNYEGRNHFRNIGPGDSVSFRFSANPAGDLMDARWNYEVEAYHRTKVYSPLLASIQFIIEGPPYEYGWTYRRNWATPQLDSFTTPGRKLIRILWPGDTARLAESFF